MNLIADNLAKVKERIEAAARRAGRSPDTVRLVAVSKTVDPAHIRAAVQAGVDCLGENYIQEAQKKIAELGHGISWHFIGHLQSNKAKVAARLFDFIHSVDSRKLAEELSRASQQGKKVLPVLLQVNVAGEESKFGTTEAGALDLVRQISPLQGISIKGLMTMPPFFDDPEKSRPYFRDLRRLAESITRSGIPGISMDELSMGMSGDYEVAIEEGATLIRVGTAIFGPRPVK